MKNKCTTKSWLILNLRHGFRIPMINRLKLKGGTALSEINNSISKCMIWAFKAKVHSHSKWLSRNLLHPSSSRNSSKKKKTLSIRVVVAIRAHLSNLMRKIQVRNRLRIFLIRIKNKLSLQMRKPHISNCPLSAILGKPIICKSEKKLIVSNLLMSLKVVMPELKTKIAIYRRQRAQKGRPIWVGWLPPHLHPPPLNFKANRSNPANSPFNWRELILESRR